MSIFFCKNVENVFKYLYRYGKMYIYMKVNVLSKYIKFFLDIQGIYIDIVEEYIISGRE